MFSITFLDNLPELRHIWLSRCEKVADFSPLRRHEALQKLVLRNSHHLVDPEVLPPLRMLQTLGLQGSRLQCRLVDLVGETPDLQTLFLDECEWVNDLSPLTTLPLFQLDLMGCSQLEDIGPIGHLEDLEFLNLSRTPICAVGSLAKASALKSVLLEGCSNVSDVSPLASLPDLVELEIRGIAPNVDLAPLAENRKLRVKIAPGQKVRGAEKLGRRLQVV